MEVPSEHHVALISRGRYNVFFSSAISVKSATFSHAWLESRSTTPPMRPRPSQSHVLTRSVSVPGFAFGMKWFFSVVAYWAMLSAVS